MKILGIDTTTKFLCLGVYDDGNPITNTRAIEKKSGICNGARIYEYTLEVDRKLSSLLAPTVNRILDSLGWKAKDIDYLVSGLGPGSFTGMRTGVSFIKGMGWALNKPIIGISTLDILAENAGASEKQIVPIIDARRSLIYCSIYKNKNNKLAKVSPYMLLSVDELVRKIKKDAIILGDAIDLYKEKILTNIEGVTFLDKDYWFPRPHCIIRLALGRIKAAKFNNAFDIKPIYLYPKECQVKR